jgi:hypothetical protein
MDLMQRLGCRKKGLFKTLSQNGIQGPATTKQSKRSAATEQGPAATEQGPAVTEAPAATKAPAATEQKPVSPSAISQALRLLTKQMKDKKQVLQPDRKRRKYNVEKCASMYNPFMTQCRASECG